MTDKYENIRKAIECQDVRSVVLNLFEDRNRVPFLRTGFGHERDLWDFKRDVPRVERQHRNLWSGIAADVLAFHNSGGGVLIFGLTDRTFHFCGCTETLDAKLFNEKIRRFLGDRFYVSFSREFIQENQRYMGVALIPSKRKEYLRFRADGYRPDGSLYFSKGDIAVRENDETIIKRGQEARTFLTIKGQGSSVSLFGVDKPGYRILAPDYSAFIPRKQYCQQIIDAIRSPRTFVTALTGIGGVGKTALACWAVHQVYEDKDFEYICSMTAKDRELTSSGISAIRPMLTSFTELIDQIIEVIGFTQDAPTDFEEREKYCRKLIENESLLLFVDNLETVDDARIIRFLETLPQGVRAIVTSRRQRVKVAANPIEIGTLDKDEAISFLESSARQRNKIFFVDTMSRSEREKVVDACDRVPLVIEWFVARARAAGEASDFADILLQRGCHSDQLLEFCFRNVYDQMSTASHRCLKVLSLFARPLPIEAVSVGSEIELNNALDAIEELKEYGLIETRYDDNYHDDTYSLLPVTRSFVYREVKRSAGEENRIRSQLSHWYEALDISNPVERELMREVRAGSARPELTIVEIAKQKWAQRDLDGAERLFHMAIERSPTSWIALREAAEFYRHERHALGEALALYERAEPFVPKKGFDRALFYREWGIITRQSGELDSQAKAVERFQKALEENPNDRICRFALGQTLERMGHLSKAIEVLELIRDSTDPETRKKTRDILLNCYRKTGDMLRVVELEQLRNT